MHSHSISGTNSLSKSDLLGFFEFVEYAKACVKLVLGGTGKRRVIFTAIFGNYDELNDPVVTDRESDYVCFTDGDSVVSDKWVVICLKELFNIDQFIAAKTIKILGVEILEQYSESIWVDGSTLLLDSPWRIVDGNPIKGDFGFVKHPDRDCVYEELLACKLQRKDSDQNLKAVEQNLMKSKYPIKNGLIWGGMIYRKNTDLVKTVFREWMVYIVNWSRRDQLSFNYLCWHHGLKIEYYYINQYCNPFFATMPHSNSSKGRWMRLAKLIYEKIRF
jgi:hypothetical protein